MPTLTAPEAIQRLKENENRLDDFVNALGQYMTRENIPVETIRSFLARKEAEVNGFLPSSGGINHTPEYTGSQTTTVRKKLDLMPDLADICILTTANQGPNFQSLLDQLPEYSQVILPKGLTLSLQSQVEFKKPVFFTAYGQIQLSGSTTLGTPIMKVTSDDVSLNFKGPIRGNNTNWGGVQVGRPDRCLRNVDTHISWIDNLNPTQVSVSQQALSYLSVIGGSISIRGKNLGGYGLYTQFCQDVHGEDISLQDVNYSAVNASANISCSFKKVRARRIGYFGVKGGYGLNGAITNHFTPTTTTFAIPKTAASVLTFKEGQELAIVYNSTTCLFPSIAKIEELTDHFKITTAEPMLAAPAAGMQIQILDGTHWEDVETWWTGDTSPDFNGVGRGFKMLNFKCRYTGMFTGFGDRRSLGCPWLGYDPQPQPGGLPDNNGFRLNNIEVRGFDSDQSAGPGLQVLCVERNCIVQGVATNYAKLVTQKDGSFLDNDPHPTIAGIEVNTLTFAPCWNVHIDFNCTSKNGLSHFLNYCLYGSIRGTGMSGAGVLVQDNVGGVDLIDMIVVSSIPGASALEIKKGSQVTTDVRTLGGRFTANGTGSIALNVSADNASQIMISETTKFDVEPSGILVANNSPNGFSSPPKYANLPTNCPLVVPIGQAIETGVNCIVAPGVKREVCRVGADNGTNALIDVLGAAWQSGLSTKESFAVFLQGDKNTVSSNSPVFTSRGSVNSSQFMDKDAAGAPIRDWTCETTGDGFRLLYTNHKANTVNLNMIIKGISRK